MIRRKRVILTLLLAICVKAWQDPDSSPIDKEQIPNNRIRKHNIIAWTTYMSDKENFAEEPIALSNDPQKMEHQHKGNEQTSNLQPSIIPTPVESIPIEITSQGLSSSNTDDTASLPQSQTKTFIGVFYYPWYDGVPFNGGKYIRNMLKPPQRPALGEYNDRDPAVIAQHLKWCKQANIGLWVTSWWGPGSRTDVGVLSSILPHPDIGDLKIALFYETTGRIPLFKTGSPNLSNVASDIEHMAKNYFNHPNYLQIDNRPVLVIYLTRSMPSLVQVVSLMRQAAQNAGYSLYIIGDEAFGKAPSSDDALKYLDGLTNYDVYGSLNPGGYYAGQSAVDAYFNEQKKWRALANAAGKSYIPGITPGYNDLGNRDACNNILSRQLTPSADFGSLFRSMMKQALPLVDDGASRILLINSWNQWMEDSMIEPVFKGTGVTKKDNSTSGEYYSKGIHYEDYGELYLNILTEETSFPVTSTPTPAQPASAKPFLLKPAGLSPSIRNNQTTAALIGVFYYPWYNGVGFNGGKYMRKMLDPPQRPALGEYNDRDPTVIAQHLKWCKQANIGLWVTSWWGPGSRTDVGVLSSILPHPDIGDLKIALFYETTGRIPLFKTGSPNLSYVTTDIEHMAKNYFNHPNYLQIDNRPVLVIYLTRSMSSLGKVVSLMRQAAQNAGYDLYIIGDEAFGKAPASDDALNYLDGVANYDVYGSLNPGGYYAGQSTVDAYFTQQRKWRALANASGKSYIPVITPGYNDLGVRNVGHIPLSRQLDANSDFGSLFRSMIKQALPLVDYRANRILLITSWNEWMEDTMIEPVLKGSGVTNVDISSSGQFYTKGINYDDYGELYLNILKEETLIMAPSSSFAISPLATQPSVISLAATTAKANH